MDDLALLWAVFLIRDRPGSYSYLSYLSLVTVCIQIRTDLAKSRVGKARDRMTKFTTNVPRHYIYTAVTPKMKIIAKEVMASHQV